MDFWSVVLGEAHEGEDVGLGLVEEGGELGQLGPQLIGDPSPLQPGGLGIVLGEGGGDEGGDDAAAALAGMSQGFRMKCTRDSAARRR
jgi:hypothetical protein